MVLAVIPAILPGNRTELAYLKMSLLNLSLSAAARQEVSATLFSLFNFLNVFKKLNVPVPADLQSLTAEGAALFRPTRWN